MGIVNITDDSYFAQSRCFTPDLAVDLCGRHIREGADIIDIGACSTRPGSIPVSAEEEWTRLEPALRAIRAAFPYIRISVDTFRSEVVEKVYALIGDFIVNDVSAGEDDPHMLDTVGRLGLTYIAMHKRGTPTSMQDMTVYEDVVSEVIEYFRTFSIKAEAAGIKNWIVDPGFGFAKTIGQNYEILQKLRQFKAHFPARKLLVGVSRKSMVYRLLGITADEALPATQVVHYKALCEGADILRVHDVSEAVRTVSLFSTLEK